MNLSPCAREYAASLANPFTGPAACIPDYPALLTRKVRVWAKGTFATSATTGFGCIVMDPLQGVCGDSSYFVASTTSALNSVTPTFTQAAGGAGNTYSASNSEYSLANFDGGANGSTVRVVSAGLRVRYIGTELNRGGQIIGLTDPNHNSIMTADGVGKTLSDIEGNSESRRFAVDRTWKCVLFRPVDNNDNVLVSNDFMIGDQAIFAPGHLYMTFYIQAASATTSLSYEWEAYANYEVAGRNVRGKTPSHYDPNGFASVHAATAHSNLLLPSENTEPDRVSKFLTHAEHYLNNALSWGGQIARIGNTLGPVLSSVAEVM